MRIPDNIYHKPSSDEMAEMLKVVMMSQSSMDPVPIQYNSCILHVLEAYNDLRVQMLTKDEALKILKQNHARDIKDFEELANSWQMKEKDYQVEVKRLEVLLSKTEGGMEMVSLARSNSSIHGSQKAAETIRKGIGSIKDRNRDGSKLPRIQALAHGNNLVADKLEYRGTPEIDPAPNDNQCMTIRHSESQYQRNIFADVILFPKLSTLSGLERVGVPDTKQRSIAAHLGCQVIHETCTRSPLVEVCNPLKTRNRRISLTEAWEHQFLLAGDRSVSIGSNKSWVALSSCQQIRTRIPVQYP
jgi:hypothetical protein